MRRSKEIIFLLVLLLGAVAFVLGYVARRRAQMREHRETAPRAIGPVAPDKTKPPPGKP